MTIGEKIKKIRKEKGMTQKELGEKCGIADSAIRRYELGGAKPKIETLQKIAMALNVPWDMLLADTPPSEKNDIIKLGIQNMVDSMYFGDIEFKSSNNLINSSIEIIEKRHKYINLYDRLNVIGQNKAIERVEELTEIPRYTQKEEYPHTAPLTYPR